MQNIKATKYKHWIFRMQQTVVTPKFCIQGGPFYLHEWVMVNSIFGVFVFFYFLHCSKIFNFVFVASNFFTNVFHKKTTTTNTYNPLVSNSSPTPPSLFLLQANILMESWLKTWFLSPLVTLGQHERMSEMMEGGGGRCVVFGWFLGDVSWSETRWFYFTLSIRMCISLNIDSLSLVAHVPFLTSISFFNFVSENPHSIIWSVTSLWTLKSICCFVVGWLVY